MTPLKTTTKFILCLAVAINCQAEDNVSNKHHSEENEKSIHQIVISSDSAEVRRLTSLGFQYILTACEEKALFLFQQAVSEDPQCLLAHAGVLLSTAEGSDIYRNHLRQLNTLIASTSITPIEEWYLASFLQLACGDLQGAATAFHERASKYRRDMAAACWDIVLNHYSTKNTSPDLLQRAEKLLEKSPDSALAHYCRALLDEWEIAPTEAGLHSALKAAELMPYNPGAQLLAGHILSRSGRFQAAVAHFQHACSLADAESETSLIAQLNQISAHIHSGTRNSWIQALKEARTIALNTPRNASVTNYAVLHHWEAKTLLLRMLVLQQTPPAGSAINEAAKTCNAPAESPLELVQNCLISAIRARSLAETGRNQTAMNQLKESEKLFQRLQREGEEIMRKGGMHTICYQRAAQACMGAMYRAKMSIYPSSKDIWKEHLTEVLGTPQYRLLPHVLPHSVK